MTHEQAEEIIAGCLNSTDNRCCVVSQDDIIVTIKPGFCEALCVLMDAYTETNKAFKRARNELCLRCGKYRDAHNGSCDGCMWKDVNS